MFSFVHGGNDLVEPKGDGGIVLFSSVEECICTCGQGNEMVWATKGHDSCILGDKRFFNAKPVAPIRISQFVRVSSCVDISQEPDSVGDAHIVVNQSCTQLGLAFPGGVVIGEPEEVVVL